MQSSDRNRNSLVEGESEAFFENTLKPRAATKQADEDEWAELSEERPLQECPRGRDESPWRIRPVKRKRGWSFMPN